jgi:hypothetical protein
MFYLFYLDCAIHIGFNDQGRCFDPATEIVYHSESFAWGLLAIFAAGMAIVTFILFRRKSRG